jgi:hypothetical protein
MLYFEQYIIGTTDVVNMSSIYQYLIVHEQGKIFNFYVYWILIMSFFVVFNCNATCFVFL